MAQDKGFPPLSRTVEVQIDVVDRANNPPVWDHVVYGPIYIRENLPVGAKVVSVKARSVASVFCRTGTARSPVTIFARSVVCGVTKNQNIPTQPYPTPPTPLSIKTPITYYLSLYKIYSS